MRCGRRSGVVSVETNATMTRMNDISRQRSKRSDRLLIWDKWKPAHPTAQADFASQAGLDFSQGQGCVLQSVIFMLVIVIVTRAAKAAGVT